VQIDAWVAESAGAPMNWQPLNLDRPRSDEVCVRIRATGICHTDVSYIDGSRPAPFPLVAGHEGAGVVTEVGPEVNDVEAGDHVVISFASCGSCRSCRLGRPAYCSSFRSLNTGFAGRADGSPQLTGSDGRSVTGGFFGQSSFATHALTRSRSVTVIPADVPFHIAAPLACGVQTGAGAVLNSLEVSAGDTIAVFGVGAVGLSAVMAAAVAGASVIVAVDPVESRRELALSLGASVALHPDEATDAGLRALVPAGFDYALDTSGRTDVIRTAVAATHSTGSIGLIAAGPPGTEITIALRDLVVGRRIRGLVEGDSVPQVFIPVLIELWRSGRFAVDALVTTYRATDLPAALQAMRTGDVVKPVLVFSDDHPIR
jgi:aryl-alcohol dehydrogenase